jgi:hypothetical protein
LAVFEFEKENVMTMRKLGMIGFALGLVFWTNAVEAQINVDKNFEGTIMVTTPEGKVVMLDAGNPVPVISLQSTLEVFQGKMAIKLEKGDSASVGCLGQTGSVNGPASVEVECGEKKGSIKAVKGEIDFEGSKIPEGQKKLIVLDDEKQAPATAAGEETGIGIDQGIPPVDSRSIQTSPSQ